jgi:hypothetical protein
MQHPELKSLGRDFVNGVEDSLCNLEGNITYEKSSFHVFIIP